MAKMAAVILAMLLAIGGMGFMGYKLYSEDAKAQQVLETYNAQKIEEARKKEAEEKLAQQQAKEREEAQRRQLEKEAETVRKKKEKEAARNGGSLSVSDTSSVRPEGACDAAIEECD